MSRLPVVLTVTPEPRIVMVELVTSADVTIGSSGTESDKSINFPLNILFYKMTISLLVKL